MAEIPVEKKGGIPGWLWLLLALLLIALLIWLFTQGDDDVEEAVVADDVEQVEPVAAGLVVGEAVNLDGVRVTELTGDMSFMIDHAGQEVPVFFNQVPTPDTATEGKLDINPGMIVDIDGEVRDSTTGLPDGADPSFLGDQQNYIFASAIEPVS